MTPSPRARVAAERLARAFREGRPLAPFSAEAPLSAEDAAAAAGLLRAGRRIVGRKIGFTNRALWPLYGVDAPIWGAVHPETLLEAGAPVALAGLMEPRLEPEIALGLAEAPEAGDDAAALHRRLAWVAPAFEVVQSPYPGWRFDTADATAAGALHGRLILGAKVPAGRIAPEALAGLRVVLRRDGAEVARGVGAAALGGPLEALAHLVRVLAAEGAPALAAGEVVSTGTLTDAAPIAPGEAWEAAFDAPLGALRVVFA